MSLAYVQPRQQRGKSEVNQAAIQKMLDENNHLIQCILDHQSKGKTMECSQYQQMLHRNLVYLATLADSSQNTQSLLPTLPNQNITMAQGGLGHQVSGSMNLPANNHGYSHSVPSSQGLPAQAAPMGSYGGRPTGSDRQGRMIAQQGGASQYSIPQSVGQHYQGMMGQNNASGQIMAQRQMPGYSRAVQSGPAQQYASPDDYFGEQYAHGQSSEGMGHQYYTDGRNDFSYQQPSYPEQSFDRTFEDPSQHYYDGGSGQYTQQQSSYQAAPQQGYPQQFTGQQGYSSQQQGYAGAAAGTAQYTAYPQTPGQQYGAYRPPQSAAPNAQQQRSYTYEQGQYVSYQQ